MQVRSRRGSRSKVIAGALTASVAMLVFTVDVVPMLGGAPTEGAALRFDLPPASGFVRRISRTFRRVRRAVGRVVHRARSTARRVVRGAVRRARGVVRRGRSLFNRARRGVGRVWNAVRRRIGTLVNKGAGLVGGLLSQLGPIGRIAGKLGLSPKTAQQVFGKIKKTLACFKKGVAKKKKAMFGFLGKALRNPGGALKDLVIQGFDLVRRKVPVLLATMKDLVTVPKTLWTSMPKQAAGAQEIDPEKYEDLVKSQVPRMLGQALKRFVMRVPDIIQRGFDKLAGSEFPFSCLAPLMRNLFGRQRQVVDKLLGAMVTVIPRLYKSGVADKLNDLLGKVLHVVADALSNESTIAGIKEWITKFYIRKLPELDRMVTKARQLLKNPTPQGKAEALKLAARLENEIPFLRIEFWLDKLAKPLAKKIVELAKKVLEDGTEIVWSVLDVAYNAVDMVVDYVGAFIPWVSDVGTTVVEVISTVITVVYKVANFLVNKIWKGVILGVVLPKLSSLAIGIAFAALKVGARKIDDALTGLRTKRKLPFKGPIAVLASGIVGMYNKFVRPFLGKMQVHVTFVSNLVRRIAGQSTCATPGR